MVVFKRRRCDGRRRRLAVVRAEEGIARESVGGLEDPARIERVGGGSRGGVRVAVQLERVLGPELVNERVRKLARGRLGGALNQRVLVHGRGLHVLVLGSRLGDGLGNGLGQGVVLVGVGGARGWRAVAQPSRRAAGGCPRGRRPQAV